MIKFGSPQRQGKLRFTFLLIFGLLISSNIYAHKFYVSMTDIDYNEKDKSLQISLKLTAHDLEIVLKEEGKGSMNFGSELEHDSAKVYLYTYIKSHFQIEVDQKDYDYKIIGFEVFNDENMYVYIEAKNINSIQELIIDNTILIDDFPKQVNYIHFKHKGFVLSEACNKEKSYARFKFKNN